MSSGAARGAASCHRGVAHRRASEPAALPGSCIGRHAAKASVGRSKCAGGDRAGRNPAAPARAGLSDARDFRRDLSGGALRAVYPSREPVTAVAGCPRRGRSRYCDRSIRGQARRISGRRCRNARRRTAARIVVACSLGFTSLSADLCARFYQGARGLRKTSHPGDQLGDLARAVPRPATS